MYVFNADKGERIVSEQSNPWEIFFLTYKKGEEFPTSTIDDWFENLRTGSGCMRCLMRKCNLLLGQQIDWGD